MALDTAAIRQQFPILQGNQLTYLDSAATTQKPQAVLDAMDDYYKTKNANAHRGMHALAEAATIAYEDARAEVANWLNAKKREIVFTSGCTESINLVAKSWGQQNLQAGDSIVLTALEHHSNIVPWQQLSVQKGLEIHWLDIDEHGHVRLDQLETYLQTGTVKLVSVTGLSNVLGTKTDLHAITKQAHAAGALVLVDAAQLAAHEQIDIASLDCDFLTFSGHKVYGPLGIGVLYGKADLLEATPPFLGGGSMIENVTTSGFTPAEIPHKFEAGTQPIAEAVGLQAALKWVSQFDFSSRLTHEQELLSYAQEKLIAIEGLTVIGTPTLGCISFTVDGVHPHDLTEIIGRKGVCLRAGHHCTQPLHDALGITATTRMSFGIYNTREDVDTCIQEMQPAIKTLR